MDHLRKNKQSPPDLLLVDAETLAARYGLAIKTVRKWGAEGFFPVVKLSRRAVRYPLDACDRIIESRRVKADSEI